MLAAPLSIIAGARGSQQALAPTTSSVWTPVHPACQLRSHPGCRAKRSPPQRPPTAPGPTPLHHQISSVHQQRKSAQRRGTRKEKGNPSAEKGEKSLWRGCSNTSTSFGPQPIQPFSTSSESEHGRRRENFVLETITACPLAQFPRQHPSTPLVAALLPNCIPTPHHHGPDTL